MIDQLEYCISVCLGSRPPLRIWTRDCCGNSHWRSITGEAVYWWRTSSYVIGSSGFFLTMIRICTLQHFLCFFLPFCLTLGIFKEFFLYSFQVLINGLRHFVSLNVKPKLQMVETFIKVSVIKDKTSKMMSKWCGIGGGRVGAWPILLLTDILSHS